MKYLKKFESLFNNYKMSQRSEFDDLTAEDFKQLLIKKSKFTDSLDPSALYIEKGSNEFILTYYIHKMLYDIGKPDMPELHGKILVKYNYVKNSIKYSITINDELYDEGQEYLIIGVDGLIDFMIDKVIDAYSYFETLNI